MLTAASSSPEYQKRIPPGQARLERPVHDSRRRARCTAMPSARASPRQGTVAISAPKKEKGQCLNPTESLQAAMLGTAWSAHPAALAPARAPPQQHASHNRMRWDGWIVKATPFCETLIPNFSSRRPGGAALITHGSTHTLKRPLEMIQASPEPVSSLGLGSWATCNI